MLLMRMVLLVLILLLLLSWVLLFFVGVDVDCVDSGYGVCGVVVDIGCVGVGVMGYVVVDVVVVLCWCVWWG